MRKQPQELEHALLQVQLCLYGVLQAIALLQLTLLEPTFLRQLTSPVQLVGGIKTNLIAAFNVPRRMQNSVQTV